MGVGAKPRVCASFCQQWFQACAASFFEFDPRTDELRACAADSQTGVCAWLSEMLPDGASLCRHSKLQVALSETHPPNPQWMSQGEPCYDGKATPVMPSCRVRSASGRKKRASKLHPALEDHFGMWSVLLVAGLALFSVTAFRHIRAFLRRHKRTGLHARPRGKPRYAR